MNAMRLTTMTALAVFLTAGLVVAADKFPATGGDIEITPIIHSSVQIEHAGKVIQIDPWSVGDLSRAKPADLILITDDPGHHLDVKAIQQLRKPGAPVVIAANGRSRVPDGIVLANGEATTAAGVRVESIAAYDVKPGPPEHPKGEANGYVITLGGRRIYVAGVTECVPEVKALKGIDVAFMPMNIPPDRMMPAAAAECTRLLEPKVVYVYHYDQDFASRATNPGARPQGLPGGITIAQSLQAFRDAMKGSSTEVRVGDWYPLRAVYLSSNPAQAVRDPVTGAPRGAAVDLARELGRRLGREATLTGLQSPQHVIDAVRTGQADIGFVAYNPERAGPVQFSQPYMLVQQTFLVGQSSRIRSVADIDRPNLRIGAGKGDSIALYLARTLKQAQLVEVTVSMSSALQMVLAGTLDAFGANRQRLTDATQSAPGLRLLPDDLYGVEQTIIVPMGQSEMLNGVNQFIDDVRRSGFLREAIERSGVIGIAVAPPSSK